MVINIVVTNYVLTQRIERKPYLYLVVLFLNVFLLSFLAIQTLLPAGIPLADKIGITFPNAFIAYFLVAESILIIGRFTRNLVILPNELALYPLSKSTLFLTTVLANVIDSKFFIYFLPVCIYLFHLVMVRLILAVYGLLLFAIFYVTLEISLVMIYLWLTKYFHKYKSNLSIIYSIMIIMYVFIGSDHLGFIAQIPVIGWVGAGVDAMTQGMVISATIHAGALIGLLALELLIGFVLIHKTPLVY